jgi:O-antigen ligase
MLSISRAIFFIRFIIFVFAIVEIFKDKKNERIIFFYWLAIILVVIFDIYVEYIYGKNLIGNTSTYDGRISSFLGKELKIGHFLYSIFLPIFSYFLLNLRNKINNKNYFALLFFFGVIVAMSAIILTGERANSIKSLFCFIFFFILIKDFKIQKKIILAISLFFLVIFISKQKERFTFLGDYQRLSSSNYNYSKYIKNSLHGSHYITAWKIFKNYPYLGVGNKNFRLECGKEIYYDKSFKHSEYRCSTHPHQIYFEFLSELGIFGTIIILYFIIYILVKSFFLYFKKFNLILLSSALFILSNFIPLIPSGSFFTSFGAALFWLNIGILLSNLNKN